VVDEEGRSRMSPSIESTADQREEEDIVRTGCGQPEPPPVVEEARTEAEKVVTEATEAVVDSGEAAEIGEAAEVGEAGSRWTDEKLRELFKLKTFVEDRIRCIQVG
jgi:hypothetical protein